MKILAVFAHPDDESFGPAGTLSHYANSGHQVGLVTLTRGEAGSSGISKELPPAELASRRTCELHQAVRVLGFNYLKIFDLPDKKLSEVPDRTALTLIQSEIDLFRPDILVTFHEQGISGHLDHQTVSRWLLQLVRNSEESRSLFFYGIIPEQAKHFSLKGLLAMPMTEVTHKIAVADLVDIKIQAMKCHVTQEKSWQKFIQPLEKLKSFVQWEYFKQVWPEPEKNRVLTDLF
jgi:LmbE family N-acetylglucosaminyl deacetylase